MKNINKISILLLLFMGLTFTSCETTDLDLINDPNQITVANGDLERYMVSIQIDFKSFVNQMGINGAQLVRMEYMGQSTYINAFDATSTNSEWRLAYSNMFSDMKNAEVLAVEKEADKHLAVMKVLKAYSLLTLVDYFGDIPNSEASDLENFPQPNTDEASTVYAFALSILDEAIVLFNSENGLNIENDYYYSNNFEKWIKLANTLKMNAYVNTRLVDTDAMSKFNAIANTGNFISTTADDFQFNYDIVVNNNIDSRHPGYQADYTAAGVTDYRSNYLMDEMLNDNDPRIRYYFFRQNDCTPGAIDSEGNICPENIVTLFCSSTPTPDHYVSGMVYCSVDSGYWGRDHGFFGGIPPDTFKRTARGVYPAAGNFDDDRFSGVGIGQGGAGAGIEPIYLASWSHLMLAEMALANGSSTASSHLGNAMQISIDKVMSFGSLDPDGNLADFAPSSSDVSDYISTTVSDFSNGNSDTKWNIFGVQHLVAHYGNGSDSYNFYRRTGYPTTVQYTVEQTPGNFVRSFLYPADEANTNPNINQKPNVDALIFWDNNPASPAFPIAN